MSPRGRHGYSGLRASHGVSKNHRSLGSTGQCQDPGKVFKGKKMAGQLGGAKVTLKNTEVLYVNIEDNILVLKEGQIVEKGDHKSLIQNENSYYSKLWNIQTGAQLIG